MKNIRFLGIALVALLTLGSGCSSSEEGSQEPTPTPGSGSVVGTWHMVSWSNASTAADVYVEFAQTGSFNLYQRVYSPEYVRYTGTYTLAGTKIEGRYSDGVAWGNAYNVSFADNGSRMTFVSTTSADDVSVFVKETIPDSIISGEMAAEPASRADEPRFF